MARGALALALALAACAPARRAAVPAGGEETVRVVTLDSAMKATIVAPARLDLRRHVDLILYALPNGNSTEETIGRRIADGVGWRFDIQHIGAQTRALRARGLPQAVVVYLEAASKSWPEWRRVRGYEAANARIVAMVERVRAELGNPDDLGVTLTGHSGGGSFMFGVIEGSRDVPDWIERIAFLDANYNFEPKHGERMLAWLRRDPRHTLVSVAYDDREIMLDGKKVVSDSGGTWRATQRMVDYLAPRLGLTRDTLGAFIRYSAPQVELLAHPNPANRILHTEMIGEMNGYMHALLVRRPGYSDLESVLRPARAYEPWIRP